MLKQKWASFKDKRIVAIGAHPDDVEFGAGGTLLQLGKANEIKVIVVSDGQMGSHDADINKGELVSLRQKEAKEAAEMYQAKQVIFFDFLDTRVGEDKKRLVKKLVKRLVKWQPDLVITHDPWKAYTPYHADHVAVGIAVLDAVMLATLPGYVKKLNMSALKAKPTVWLMHPQERQIEIDIKDVLEKKLAMIKKFASQFDEQVQWEDIKRKLSVPIEAFAEIDSGVYSGVEE